MKFKILFFILAFLTTQLNAQYTLSGIVTNTALQPMRYVSVSIKELQLNTQTNAEGKYSFRVDEGKYDLVITMVGYKAQLLTLVVNAKDVQQNIIIEENKVQGEEAQVFAIRKDRWKEIMTNVIRNKENYLKATSTYSCNVYIRASQENEKTVFKKRKDWNIDSVQNTTEIAPPTNEKLANMSMGEIVLKLDKTEPNKIKETRTGVKIRGNVDNLFYLHTTDGDFNIYQNLIKVPALTKIPMLSPVSTAGLSAYKFKTIRLRKKNGRKFYTISFTPEKSGNALIEGEIEVMDSLWLVTATNYSFPNYMLNEYDYFGVEQEYDTTNYDMFLLGKQDLTYVSKLGKNVSTGRTLAIFNNYNIDPSFSKKYFNNELASTTQDAYEQDSSFWDQVRQEPLSSEQLAFIKYSDSVSRAHSTKVYMDSVDAVFNKITFSKVLFNGQGFYSRKKERSFFVGPAIALIQPLQFAGTRIALDYDYNKTYGSRKNEVIWGNINYGFKNRDTKGEIKLRKLYQPFTRGAYEINLSRKFQSLYQNGSWQDQLKRSGVYESDDIGIQHEREITNGLFIYNKLEYSYRRDATRYKINMDSINIFGLYKQGPKDSSSIPISFPAYQGLYNTISFSYTPQQKYIREPREKIILGSKWPTFTVLWKKGIPRLASIADFDYFEYKIDHKVNLNRSGVLQYSFTSGKFLNQTNIEKPDYRFIRQGDSLVFLKPTNTFQAMDITRPVFDWFYEFHLVHNFNGALINKIPFMKKLKLQEIAGGGLFYSKEHNIKYWETFFGLEKTAKVFRDRYKVGAYIVFAGSNKMDNSYRIKFSFEKFNRRRASWY